MRLGTLRRLITEAILNAYSILGVSPTASADEIKKAYRTKALELHPDRNPGKDTNAEMVQVNVAKDVLSDPAKRSKLDFELRYGGVGIKAQPPSPKPAYDPYGWRPKPKPPEPKPSGPTGPEGWPMYGERHYYTYEGGKSRKFWWAQRVGKTAYVGWGRSGTAGQKRAKEFSNVVAASSWIRSQMMNKQAKGYKKDTPYYQYSEQNPPSPYVKKSVASSPKPKGSTPRQAGPKTTYKVYGRKGPSHVHTRHKGRAYIPDPKGPYTKFRNNDRAEVRPGDKPDTVKVKNPQTSHEQTWSYYREGLDELVGLVIAEVLLRRHELLDVDEN